MNKIFLSVVALLATLSFVQGAETQTQPEVGKPAPDFSLTTGDGSQVSLKDYRGKWIVLYFYPKDFTSGCTMEAHNFQRDLSKYEQTGAVILGVSVDTAQSHKDFCAKEGLNFKLIDCRDYPSEKNCSLKISGTEDEVLDAAVQHAVSAHRHEETPELREQIRSMLKDDSD